MIDATHSKAHRTAASLLKKQVLSSSKGVYSQTMRPRLHVRSLHRRNHPILDQSTSPEPKLVKGAYNANWLRDYVSERGGWTNIPPKSLSKKPDLLLTLALEAAQSRRTLL